MLKSYRVNCPIYDSFVGIDLHYTLGRSGNQLILPTTMRVLHLGQYEHHIEFTHKPTNQLSNPQVVSK